LTNGREALHRVFISDLHLEDPSSPAFCRFNELMGTESARVEEIYVLGDLVEMWIGDDDDSPCAEALAATLYDAAQACRVYVMHGNRDFLFGDAFATRTGITLLDDPYDLDHGVVLSHGDLLCTDDVDYQAFRKTVRDPAWQADILAKSLAERQAFGAGLRAQSKTTNANKPTNIMDVNDEAKTELLAEHGAHTLLHGHTHRPGRHPDRVVLGAWERCGWLCRQVDEAFQLECFGLGTPYAGIPL
jgi:UDP-2,3-diacylglucosamine hydrolase